MPPTDPLYSIIPLGDRALIVELGSGVSAALSARVRVVYERLQRAKLAGVRDLVPAFCSLAVHYDPLAFASATRSPFAMLSALLTPLIEQATGAVPEPSRMIEIPVCYGGDYGEDLDAVARAHALTPDQVIQLHSAPTYFVGMLGFAPGFPYLAGLDPRLATPRRATPRARVPAGSVAIGGDHTGIYPLESPGGWHLIGRTPLTLFDLGRKAPALLGPGDEVRFVAVTAETFERIQREGRWR